MMIRLCSFSLRMGVVFRGSILRSLAVRASDFIGGDFKADHFNRLEMVVKLLMKVRRGFFGSLHRSAKSKSLYNMHTVKIVF